MHIGEGRKCLHYPTHTYTPFQVYLNLHPSQPGPPSEKQGLFHHYSLRSRWQHFKVKFLISLCQSDYVSSPKSRCCWESKLKKRNPEHLGKVGQSSPYLPLLHCSHQTWQKDPVTRKDLASPWSSAAGCTELVWKWNDSSIVCLWLTSDREYKGKWHPSRLLSDFISMPLPCVASSFFHSHPHCRPQLLLALYYFALKPIKCNPCYTSHYLFSHQNTVGHPPHAKARKPINK